MRKLKFHLFTCSLSRFPFNVGLFFTLFSIYYLYLFFTSPFCLNVCLFFTAPFSSFNLHLFFTPSSFINLCLFFTVFSFLPCTVLVFNLEHVLYPAPRRFPNFYLVPVLTSSPFLSCTCSLPRRSPCLPFTINVLTCTHLHSRSPFLTCPCSDPRSSVLICSYSLDPI